MCTTPAYTFSTLCLQHVTHKHACVHSLPFAFAFTLYTVSSAQWCMTPPPRLTHTYLHSLTPHRWMSKCKPPHPHHQIMCVRPDAYWPSHTHPLSFAPPCVPTAHAHILATHPQPYHIVWTAHAGCPHLATLAHLHSMGMHAQATPQCRIHHTGTFVSQEAVRLVNTNLHSGATKRDNARAIGSLRSPPCAAKATHLTIAEDSALAFQISTTIVEIDLAMYEVARILWG